MTFIRACIIIFFSTFFLLFVESKSYASSLINATISVGVFPPNAPLNVALAIGDGEVTLSWSPPYRDGGRPITDYRIEYKLATTNTWSVVSKATSTTTSFTVSPLSNGSLYDFRIRAMNEKGLGESSSVVSGIPGSPAQVLIREISDLTTPSIVASVRITNEGSAPYEYQYQWCVTDAETNFCGSGDDVVMSMAAKLIAPEEDWDTELQSTVATPGMYWFHLEVHYGSSASYAVRSFIATNESNKGGGSGGGRSSGEKKSRVCIGGDLNKDRSVNIIDFSILLSSWGHLSPFKNECVDINSDGKVNLIDFSILLSQWGKRPWVVEVKE